MVLGLIFVGFVVFSLGFFFYSRWLEGLFGVDPARPTPAVLGRDDVDKVPALWPVLFGHHFASIAGAAPIIGPVLAISLWGWVPVYWWVILGSAFVGGLHDFGALMISLRFGGKSIAKISEYVLSPRAKWFFSVFLYLALVLVVAVFASVTAKTFVEGPEIVIPSLGLILVAVGTGYLLNELRWSLVWTTFLGLAGLALLMAVGSLFPIAIAGEHAQPFWISVLMIYALIASITPVHYLLQPRDYLSSYLLFFGLIVGYWGLFLLRPSVNLPQHTMTNPLGFWPMLFVVVACGAVSGFHSLISSGTTARQIANESHGRLVVYLAMLAEGALALLSTLVIITGFDSLSSFLSSLQSQGPISAFSQAFGRITKPLLGDWGAVFGMIMLNSFVLTTLDTATRIGRYVVEEITGIRNRVISSGLIILPALVLALSGHWKAVWPLFGSANQLIAAMVLFILSVFLTSRGRRSWWIIIMSSAMYITIVSALYLKAVEFFNENVILWLISLGLLGLAVYMLVEGIAKVRRGGK